jgi:hypothetical protein
MAPDVTVTYLLEPLRPREHRQRPTEGLTSDGVAGAGVDELE